MSNNESNLILENSLQCFFYDQLKNVNERTLSPLSNEQIFYSSLVLDRFGDSQNYFEFTQEGVKEKALGLKLLETSHLPLAKQKRILKEVADTSLLLCGYFSESFNRKIIDLAYYRSIGENAYQKLNTLVPEMYDVEGFYYSFSASFAKITDLITIVSKQLQNESPNSYLIISKKTKAA